MKKLVLTILILIIFLVFNPPNSVRAHSGNTDNYGGHNKNINGTYHCHSGQCIEDKRLEAENYCFPKGVDDGKSGVKDEQFFKGLLEKLDSDQFYMFEFCSEAYEKGYETTYTPTFWEQSGNKIIAGLIAMVISGYLLLKDIFIHPGFRLILGIIGSIAALYVLGWGGGNLIFNSLIFFEVNDSVADGVTIVYVLLILSIIATLFVTIINSFGNEKML